MEKPVIYTQTINTPAESRHITVSIHATNTAGQAVSWSLTYKIDRHNAKYGESLGTVSGNTYNDFADLSTAIKDFFEPVKMA